MFCHHLIPIATHQIVFGKINFHVPAPPIYKSKIWEYKACNISNFRHDLKSVGWAKLLGVKSIDEMTDIFTKTFLEIATRHTPSKLISVSDKDAPWINPSIKTAIKRNKRVYKKWVSRGRIPNEKLNVNTIQKQTNVLINDAKKAYIKSLSLKLCDPNSGSKVFWSAYKNCLIIRKITNIPPILENGAFISDFKEKAKIFNQYFSNQCTPLLSSSKVPDSLEPLVNSELDNICITEEDIIIIINKLNSKKAHGVDGISIPLLKMLSQRGIISFENNIYEITGNWTLS